MVVFRAMGNTNGNNDGSTAGRLATMARLARLAAAEQSARTLGDSQVARAKHSATQPSPPDWQTARARDWARYRTQLTKWMHTTPEP